MSKTIRVRDFFQDVSGPARVTKLRREAMHDASPLPERGDFVRSLAERLHPGVMRFRVLAVRETSPSSRTYRLCSEDGHIPPFQSGQYISLRLRIGGSVLTRPYSISSSPFQALGHTPFIEITVRRSRPRFVPDYLFANVKLGDVLEAVMPCGHFYWEPLRDSRNLVALAGGSGITPFVSMAGEIAHGKMAGCRLTILYGSVKADDIVLGKELAALERDSKYVKVVHVLSGDPGWAREKGFLSRELIESYAGEDPTFFFSGPPAMYPPIAEIMERMGVPARRFRCDVLEHPPKPALMPGYPAGNEGRAYTLTVRRGLRCDSIRAWGGESVAVALERAAIGIETNCRAGQCGACRVELLAGDVFIPEQGDGRRMMDKELGWIHACSAWPLSDLELRIPIV